MAQFDSKLRNHNKKKSRSSLGRRNAKLHDNKQKKTSKEPVRITKPQKSRRHKKVKPYEEPDHDVASHIWADKWRADKLKESNQKPANDNDQEVMRAVLEIKKWKENSKSGIKPKKRRRNKDRSQEDGLMTRQEKGMTRPLKPVPVFKQKEKESDMAYFHRIDREAQAVVKKSQFEDKFKVDVDAHATVADAMKKKVGKKKQKEHNRLKEKKLKKKVKILEKKKDKNLDFSDFKDRVEFGDVAMAPPNLTAKPRKADKYADRPGKKSLLLKEIISQNQSSGHTPTDKRAVGQTVKRKKMSVAEQRITDKQRDKAIELYRSIKAKKIKT